MQLNAIHIVPKVWGREEWIVNNDLYCGKKLVVERGHRCSVHYHKLKNETFYILSGRLYVELDEDTRVLVPGDALDVKVGQRHRFTALETTEFFEFSTHHEDSDSHRVEVGGRVPPEEFSALIART
jgi:quercetin dioxygenase-like cupin family protein